MRDGFVPRDAQVAAQFTAGLYLISELLLQVITTRLQPLK
jgi:hypothetical protein